MCDARRIVAIIALLTFAACSNGSDGPAVGVAFARRAVTVCNDAKALKDAQGPFPYQTSTRPIPTPPSSPASPPP